MSEREVEYVAKFPSLSAHNARMDAARRNALRLPELPPRPRYEPAGVLCDNCGAELEIDNIAIWYDPSRWGAAHTVRCAYCGFVGPMEYPVL